MRGWGRVLLAALVFGVVAGVLGGIGPMLLSTSNLGPLLAVLTAPMGFLVGLAVGAVLELGRSRVAAVVVAGAGGVAVGLAALRLMEVTSHSAQLLGSGLAAVAAVLTTIAIGRSERAPTESRAAER